MGKKIFFNEKIAEKLNVFIYFAKTYHSWEGGANEVFNGSTMRFEAKASEFLR